MSTHFTWVVVYKRTPPAGITVVTERLRSSMAIDATNMVTKQRLTWRMVAHADRFVWWNMMTMRVAESTFRATLAVMLMNQVTAQTSVAYHMVICSWCL